MNTVTTPEVGLVESKIEFLQDIDDLDLRRRVAYALHGPSENRQWGSQSRGLIVLLLSEGRPYGSRRAIAIELMHCAALVVDDLLDRASERRGNPSLWSVFGSEEAVLLGHVLISMGLAELSKSGAGSPCLVEQVVADISTMARAELRAGWRKIQSAPDYLAYAHAKTGTLFERAMVFGLNSAHSSELVSAVGKIGVLHQIVDDAKDESTDRSAETLFGQCNWTSLPCPERLAILKEISHITERDWPQAKSALAGFKNCHELSTVFEQVGQFSIMKDFMALAA